MYKCRLTYDEWKCMISKDRIGKQVDWPQLKGYLGLLTINQVSEKQVWRYNEKDVIVCDNNYHWLSVMPKDDFYCITAMMDDNYKMQVCYIDMIDTQGYDSDDVPYFYDLYLDLVVYPNGDIIVDDMDELEAAYEKHHISKEQYECALQTADRLKKGLLSDIESFKNYIQVLLERLLEGKAGRL